MKTNQQTNKPTNHSTTIDLNCDMGESYGRYQIGNDDLVFPNITSSNIACGFHGGDPRHIEQTIRKAIQYKVQIGAHPGYPDLQGFGRRRMQIPTVELKSIIKYQVAALKGLVESHGAQLKYVKPHGALYNTMAKDEKEATTVVEAILSIDPSLKIMGLAGSLVEQVVAQKGGQFIAEAFADRRYNKDGTLQSRATKGAVLEDPQAIAEQVLSIVQNQQATTIDGHLVSIQAQSICIHGDNPAVVPILSAISEALAQAGISKTAF
ncbi:MAG: 5-oxoprolinase subunit PxpA [Bacteroidota bacterium]